VRNIVVEFGVSLSDFLSNTGWTRARPQAVIYAFKPDGIVRTIVSPEFGCCHIKSD
jgi:hypothetical protein